MRLNLDDKKKYCDGGKNEKGDKNLPTNPVPFCCASTYTIY